MRLFAFTREEGSDERNPWAILLRRRRAWMRDATLMGICAAGIAISVIAVNGSWRSAGLFSPAPLVAMGMCILGAWFHEGLMWQEVTRSALLIDSAVTPQRAGALMAAIERRGRRWLIFTAILLAVTLGNAYLHLALMVIPERPSLAMVHLALFTAAGFAAWSLTFCLMAATVNLRLRLSSLSAIWRDITLVVVFVLLPVFVVSIFRGALDIALGVTQTDALALPFLGRAEGLESASTPALLLPPILVAPFLAMLAAALWRIAILLWQSQANLSLDPLRETVAGSHERITE